MKIRTRLLLYNLIVVGVAVMLTIAISCFAGIYTGHNLHTNDFPRINTDSAKIDDLLEKPTESTDSRPPQREIYIYQDGEFIADDDSPTLPRLVDQFQSRNQKLIFYLVIMIIGAIIIVAILAVVLTKNLLSHVMKPLDLLNAGASRIHDGNYNQSLRYSSNDEFSPVISSFNTMQSTLKHQSENAKKLELAKHAMISGISHDLRTPLTVVKGKIKGIIDGIADTPKKQVAYLNSAYMHTLDIERLLDHLFETFDATTENLPLKLTHTNLQDFLTQTANCNQHIRDKDIAIQYIFPNTPTYLDIDQLQFKRVIDNLINNTAEHNENKQSLKATIGIEQHNNQIEILFEDNGKGIKHSKDLAKIFDEFYKEDSARSHSKSGSGLGLAITKKIVESHGGKIRAENRHGLCFIITLEQA